MNTICARIVILATTSLEVAQMILSSGMHCCFVCSGFARFDCTSSGASLLNGSIPVGRFKQDFPAISQKGSPQLQSTCQYHPDTSISISYCTKRVAGHDSRELRLIRCHGLSWSSTFQVPALFDTIIIDQCSFSSTKPRTVARTLHGVVGRLSLSTFHWYPSSFDPAYTRTTWLRSLIWLKLQLLYPVSV